MAVVSILAWPIHFDTIFSGTPFDNAWMAKPWRKPFGQRWGPSGMSAALMTAHTCRQAVTRDHGQSGASRISFFCRRWASLRPCTMSRVSLQEEAEQGLTAAAQFYSLAA